MPTRARQAAQPAPAPAAARAAAEAPVPATIDEIVEEMATIAVAAAEGTLTDEQAGRYEALEAGLLAAQRSEGIAARQRAYETPVPGDLAALNQIAPAGDPGSRNPLAYTSAALDDIQAAIEQVRRGDGLTPRRVPSNATLTTGTHGAPREWGRNVLSGPRLLHVVAGVPRQPIDAILAQFPQLTLPTPSAAVGEGASLVEYASSVSGNVTAGRFGRFTDLSQEALVGTDAAAILAMHQLGIALDLDAVLVAAVQTAAGAAVAFNADVMGQIRKAIAKVLANTAAERPEDLVILAHPDNVNLLENVTPTGGQTIAESFQRFSGALVYPSNSVTTGFMTVANLPAGVRFFEATSGAGTAVDQNVKTGVQTVATALIGGYGITLTTGFAVMQDVVTP
jgi:hypothetical protein